MMVKLTLVDNEIKKAVQCYVKDTYGLDIDAQRIVFEADQKRLEFGWQTVTSIRINDLPLPVTAVA